MQANAYASNVSLADVCQKALEPDMWESNLVDAVVARLEPPLLDGERTTPDLPTFNSMMRLISLVDTNGTSAGKIEPILRRAECTN